MRLPAMPALQNIREALITLIFVDLVLILIIAYTILGSFSSNNYRPFLNLNIGSDGLSSMNSSIASLLNSAPSMSAIDLAEI